MVVGGDIREEVGCFAWEGHESEVLSLGEVGMKERDCPSDLTCAGFFRLQRKAER